MKKRSTKPRLRLVDHHSRAREAFDERGRVRIYIRRIDTDGRFVKGNVSRSLTIDNGTVDEVFDHVRRSFVK